nr:MAG TPA: hypothetical protein [Caudoviricetes sp.]
MSVSESRKRANKKWDDSNKEQMKYLRYRSYSKTFIKVLANQEDLQVLKDLIIEREELLKNESLNTI